MRAFFLVLVAALAARAAIVAYTAAQPLAYTAERLRLFSASEQPTKGHP